MSKGDRIRIIVEMKNGSKVSFYGRPSKAIKEFLSFAFKMVWISVLEVLAHALTFDLDEIAKYQNEKKALIEKLQKEAKGWE
jgi:hypothetical protein